MISYKTLLDAEKNENVHFSEKDRERLEIIHREYDGIPDFQAFIKINPTKKNFGAATNSGPYLICAAFLTRREFPFVYWWDIPYWIYFMAADVEEEDGAYWRLRREGLKYASDCYNSELPAIWDEITSAVLSVDIKNKTADKKTFIKLLRNIYLYFRDKCESDKISFSDLDILEHIVMSFCNVVWTSADGETADEDFDRFFRCALCCDVVNNIAAAFPGNIHKERMIMGYGLPLPDGTDTFVADMSSDKTFEKSLENYTRIYELIK
ncbi:MAG: hypothetical protein KBS59_06685 [Clostridiales bacterium]|nr:hypothetical protein [Clostridiales bacterium]